MTAVLAGQFRKTGKTKFMDWPSAVYSMHPFDQVHVGGRSAGVSTTHSSALSRRGERHSSHTCSSVRVLHFSQCRTTASAWLSAREMRVAPG